MHTRTLREQPEKVYWAPDGTTYVVVYLRHVEIYSADSEDRPMNEINFAPARINDVTFIPETTIKAYFEDEKESRENVSDTLVISGNKDFLYFVQGFKSKETTKTKIGEYKEGRFRAIEFFKGEEVMAKVEENEDEPDLSTNALFLVLTTEGKLAYWCIEDILDQLYDDIDSDSDSEPDSEEAKQALESKDDPISLEPTAYVDLDSRVLSMVVTERIDLGMAVSGKKRK